MEKHAEKIKLELKLRGLRVDCNFFMQQQIVVPEEIGAKPHWHPACAYVVARAFMA